MTTSLRLLGGVALVGIAWIAIMAGVMRFSDAAPAAVVIFPSARLLAHLPDAAAILSQTGFSVTVRSDQAGLAAELYAAGAWLVLPAGLTGCLPLPQV